MNILFSIFILPIVIIYKYIFLIFATLTNNYGISLFFLSIVGTLLCMPLTKLALGAQKKEEAIQKVLAPQITHIGSTLKGHEKNAALNRLYKRYAYHPLFSIRSALSILLQLPFLTGAYYMLSNLPEIQGQSFLVIRDLSKPDGLLFGYNLLPFVMTAINIAVALTSKLSKKDFIQALVIAFLFLLLLYSAPAALLIFWTTNNIIHLIKSLSSAFSQNNAYNYENLKECTFSKATYILEKIQTPYGKFSIIVLCILCICAFIIHNFSLQSEALTYALLGFIALLLAPQPANMMPKKTTFLTSFSCLFILSTITPFIYMWAVNAYMLTSMVLLHTFLAFFVFFTLPFYIFGKFVDFSIIHYQVKCSKKIHILLTALTIVGTYIVITQIFPLKAWWGKQYYFLMDIVIAATIIGTGTFVFQFLHKNTFAIKSFMAFAIIFPCVFILEMMLPIEYWLQDASALILIKLILLILLGLITFTYSIKPINIFLLCITVISTGQFFYNKYEDNSLSLSANIHNADSEILSQENLKTKPNIYLIYLESYHDIHTLKKVFSYPIDPFVNKLKEYNYTFYDNFFANSMATAYNMYTLYTMQTEFTKQSKFSKGVPLYVNKVLIGNENNKVLEYLQRQNYYCFSDTADLVNFEPKQEKYLDATFAGPNISPDSSEFLAHSLSAAFYPIFEKLSQKILHIVKDTAFEKYLVGNTGIAHKLSFTQLSEKIMLARKQTKNITQPIFYAFYSGALHVQTLNYDYTQKDAWVSSNIYQDRIRLMNEEIRKSVQYLEQHDPNAIVILLGDHGTRLTHGIHMGEEKSIAMLTKELNNAGFTLEDFVYDHFGIFFAIKMPKATRQDISFDMPFSPVNLFRHIFAALNNDTIFLKHKVPNTSRARSSKHPLVIEGKIVTE